MFNSYEPAFLSNFPTTAQLWSLLLSSCFQMKQAHTKFYSCKVIKQQVALMEDQTLQSYILGPMTKITSYPQDDSSSITKDTEQSKHWQMMFKSEHYWR